MDGRLTVAQEKSISHEILHSGWVSGTAIKIEKTYAIVHFEDDEQTQCYKVYLSGYRSRQW